MATRITQLAKIISDNAALIEENLQSRGEAEASLGVDAPKRLPIDPKLEMTRLMAISAAREFADIMTAPAELIKWDWTEHSSERLIGNLGIASMIPTGSEVPFSEIAKKTGLPERDVRRILKHAMRRHIFCEPRDGYVAHTAISRLLAEDEGEQSISWTVNNILWPASLRTADAVKKYPGSEEAEESAFSMENCPGKSMWHFFDENKEWERKFGVFIGHLGANESLLQGVDWKGRIVDIGGGHGQAMIDVLNRHPQVTSAVVQDWEGVAKEGEERAPKDLLSSDRLKFEGHNFFTPQNQEADIYFFRWVFHNWSNKYSRKIIEQLVPRMKPGRKIIINDFLLPKWNALPPIVEKGIRMMDMTMLCLLNATERDEQAWHDLFAEVDSRFKIKSVKTTPPGLLAIIEVAWEP